MAHHGFSMFALWVDIDSFMWHLRGLWPIILSQTDINDDIVPFNRQPEHHSVPIKSWQFKKRNTIRWHQLINGKKSKQNRPNCPRLQCPDKIRLKIPINKLSRLQHWTKSYLYIFIYKQIKRLTKRSYDKSLELYIICSCLQ